MIEYKNNNHKFNRQFKKQENAIKRGLRQGAAISGKELVSKLKKDMKLPKSGRLYKTSIGMTGNPLKSIRSYRASSPNQVPAIVTGEFRRSLGFEVQGSSRLVFGSGKDGMAKYAKFLEEGTSRMKARKPLQRTAQKMDNQVNKNLNRNIKKQLAKIGVDIKMKASSVVNRIKAVLATYTEGFSSLIDINTLTCAATTITANTLNPHGLNTGDYVTIKGAKEPITLTTLTRNDNIVTAVSATDHKLIDPSKYSAQWLPIMVEITGANPAEYNGSFKLLTVADDNTFTFEITTTPASPAIAAGQLLLDDESGYNGYKQVTVISLNDFTYSTLQTLQSPAAGTIKMSITTKVSGVASPNNIVEYYNKNGAGVLDDRIFVYIDDDVVYRNDTVGNDISSQQNSNLDYFYQLQESFSIFVVTPGKDSLQGIQAADRARSYRVPLLKAIANFQFDSDLTDTKYQPAYYAGSSTDDYIKAFYVQRFDFGAITYIQNSDVNQDSNSSLLKEIDAVEQAKNLEIKVDF